VRRISLTGSILALILTLGVPAALAESGNVDFPRFPSISPDGAQVVFSWRGDLWSVDSAGGTAVRLTSHPGNDTVSAFSPDGSRIAFNSDRSGFVGVYVMAADGTGIRPVTRTDRACTLSAFGQRSDGEPIITCDSTHEADNYRSPRPFAISPEGGDLVRVFDAFGSHAVPNADGSKLLFSRGGARWSRRGYQGPDSRDVWLYDTNNGKYTALTKRAGNDGRARWQDSDTVLFVSDRELDRYNLYRMDLDQGESSAQRLTDFRDRDILSFDVADDGSLAVVMAWDTLYTVDLSRKQAKAEPFEIRANEDERDGYTVKRIDTEVSEAALSPDGKVMAYVAYGEVFVRNIEEKSPTRRVTHGHAREKQIAWSPDGLRLYFVSDGDESDSILAARVAKTRGEIKTAFEDRINPQPEEPKPEKKAAKSKGDSDNDNSEDAEKEEEPLPPELDPSRCQDAMTFTIEPVVHETTNDREPSPSPDGKSLAFRRGRGDLMILDLETGKERAVLTGWDTGLGWSWSPDSKQIAYAVSDLDFNRDIWIVAADGAAPAVNVTQHPNNEYRPRWSADGRILSFLSERVGDEYDVWMVYLDSAMETYTPKELADYYKDAAEAATKRVPLSTRPDDEANDEAELDKKTPPPPSDFDLTDAYLRLRRVTSLSGSEADLEITPGGDRYIFTATLGEPGLYSMKWDASERKRLAGDVTVRQVSLTGDKVVVIQEGRAASIPPAGETLEFHNISDEIRIDLELQSSQKFNEAARTLGEVFYHPKMKGLDWKALTERYHAVARRARTANEFNDIANRFVGELNASHLGIRAPGDTSPNARAQGRLGTEHRRVDGGFEILRVIPESPAALGAMALQPGDVIKSIEHQPFGPTDTVESRLEGRVAKETLMTVRRKMDDGEVAELDVLITPIAWGAERQLKYNRWRRENAQQVEELSDGRIGYIHIQAMNQSSLDVFERDLHAAANGKDGLLIDVRNNGGGWTTDRLLGSIMTRPHAYTIPRGADPQAIGHYPQDRLFIQRYTLPISMLCNEKSFSNAEIISHAFKALGRGTLVGQETYGAVISTGGTRLIDGTFVRLPFRGWYLLDGTDMENHGAVPDIVVEQTPEAESENRDDQLRAAVEDLLGRL